MQIRLGFGHTTVNLYTSGQTVVSDISEDCGLTKRHQILTSDDGQADEPEIFLPAGSHVTMCREDDIHYAIIPFSITEYLVEKECVAII